MEQSRRTFLVGGGLVAVGTLLPIYPAAAGTVPQRKSMPRLANVGAEDGSVPDWFTAERVQGMTHASLCGIRGYVDERLPEVPGLFADVGATVQTHLIKNEGIEDPWWPADQPRHPDDGSRLYDGNRLTCDGDIELDAGANVSQDIIDRVHDEGARIIAYYWFMSEHRLAELYPEWVCRDVNGNPLSHPRKGDYLDITGPYGEVVLDRLLELSDMGVDGFFFDNRHLPFDGIWGSAIQDSFESETGLSMPAGNDHHDPNWRRFIAHKARKIEDTILWWRDEMKTRNPESFFIVSAASVPALTRPDSTTRLCRIADSTKLEVTLATKTLMNLDIFEDNPDLAQPPEHVSQALGWAVVNGAANGRPSHVWTTGVPNTDHALAMVAHLVSHGCVANVDVHPAVLLGINQPRGKTTIEAAREAFDFGARLSPHFAGTQPLRWAACHFAEESREARAGDYRQAWEEVMWPLTGAYRVLTRAGVPVGVVNDHQLANGELDDYQLLVLTNPDELTAEQQASVDAFAASGGTVVVNDPSWPWSDPAATGDAEDAFRAVVADQLSDAPVVVAERPQDSYALAYSRSDGALVVAVTNDLTWFQTNSGGGVPPGEENPVGPPASGVRVTWRAGIGLPAPAQVTEVLTETVLDVEVSDGICSVVLPDFVFMGLLVVEDDGREPEPAAPYDAARQHLDDYDADGSIGTAEYRRIRAQLNSAERFADRGQGRQADRALDRAVDVVEQIDDDAAREHLTAIVTDLRAHL
ncbi:alpha-amylase family protein [Ruania alba]|uniref:FIMAH domain-containing protein n=1 Tax=Ruania alba TaxID=648782 RepID=A0A1H5M6Z9_9MICO|nr:alpha-amylase family protein [Ruania alba]SEE85156.1 hypothetical protein SAMN04488554_3192 [Ruania alba]